MWQKKKAAASHICSVSRSGESAIALPWWVQSAWAEARMASLAGLPERLEAFTPPDSLRSGVTNSLAFTKEKLQGGKMRICATSASLTCRWRCRHGLTIVLWSQSRKHKQWWTLGMARNFSQWAKSVDQTLLETLWILHEIRLPQCVPVEV